MSSDQLYREGLALQEKLEEMRLTDLLALNPTLDEMRHVNAILAIGYGQLAEQYHVDEVKKLLAKCKTEDKDVSSR